MLEYLEQFNYVQTIVILLCKQIRLPINYLSTDCKYNHLTLCK